MLHSAHSLQVLGLQKVVDPVDPGSLLELDECLHVVLPIVTKALFCTVVVLSVLSNELHFP